MIAMSSLCTVLGSLVDEMRTNKLCKFIKLQHLLVSFKKVIATVSSANVLHCY